MTDKTHRVYLLIMAVMLSSCVSVAAQSEPPASGSKANQWTEFSPPDGGFRVLFPGKPNELTGSVEIAGNYASTHEYFSKESTEYRVAYFFLPGSVADSPRPLLRGLADSLVAEHHATLVSDREISLASLPGRLLEANTAKGGVIRALLLVGKFRLYRVTAVIPRETTQGKGAEAALLAARFLESFNLVPIITEPPDNKYLVTEEGEVDVYIKKAASSGQPVLLEHDPGVSARLINLPTPSQPRNPGGPTNVSGKVDVKVVVDENGDVIAAQIIRGHPWLREASLGSARRAKFAPPRKDGKPVKAVGIITYNFVSR